MDTIASAKFQQVADTLGFEWRSSEHNETLHPRADDWGMHLYCRHQTYPKERIVLSWAVDSNLCSYVRIHSDDKHFPDAAKDFTCDPGTAAQIIARRAMSLYPRDYAVTLLQRRLESDEYNARTEERARMFEAAFPEAIVKRTYDSGHGLNISVQTLARPVWMSHKDPELLESTVRLPVELPYNRLADFVAHMATFFSPEN